MTGNGINTSMKNIFSILIFIVSFSAAAETSFNYEMTATPGTEKIRPLAFYDDGKATYIKFKPTEVQRLPDGRSVPILPMVYTVGKSGHASLAGVQKWNTESGIMTVPVISDKWLIRSGSKSVEVRKSTGTKRN